MELPGELIRGKLLARRKRFLADVRLADGSEVIAHCPNPGSMRGNAEPGSSVLLRDYGPEFGESGRKLRYRWLFVKSGILETCIDTGMSNGVVGEALSNGALKEFQEYSDVIPEFTVGDSRLDFCLQGEGLSPCFLEVKSVSMVDGDAAVFPDSVTKRGQKHLRELMELKAQGYRAVMFFLVQRAGLNVMRPADAIDPEYGKLLRLAVDNGVEVLVYDIEFKENQVKLGVLMELDLN